MIYLRKRSQQVSVFRFGKLFTGASGLNTITFTAPDIPEPGDTIFLNHRSSTGTYTSAPGWTLIGTPVSGLTSLARVVLPGDTGTYTYTVSGGANHSAHAMVSGATFGFTNATLTSFGAVNPCTLPSISIQKNSTILIFYTSTGTPPASRTLTPSDFSIGVNGGATIQSIYKQYFAAQSDDFTLTWNTPPGVGTRITRVEILGAT